MHSAVQTELLHSLSDRAIKNGSVNVYGLLEAWDRRWKGTVCKPGNRRRPAGHLRVLGLHFTSSTPIWNLQWKSSPESQPQAPSHLPGVLVHWWSRRVHHATTQSMLCDNQQTFKIRLFHSTFPEGSTNFTPESLPEDCNCFQGLLAYQVFCAGWW